MKQLNASVEEHKNQIETLAPFIFLFEVEVAGDPPTRLRVAQFDKTVNFGKSDAGDDIPYYPCTVNVGTVAQTSEGDLPTLDVTIGLAGPVNFLDVDTNDGFTDQPARVLVVSSLALHADPLIEEDAQIVSTSLSHEAIQFTVSGSDLFQSRFPHIVYSRTSCPYRWGGHLCQYDASVTGAAFSDCGIDTGGTELFRPFSYEACEAAGADEEALGLEVRHPKLWGGARGIPRG